MHERTQTALSTLDALQQGEAGMETLWILSTTVVVSLVVAVFKNRKSARRNLGFVSRDWVMRHGMDHTGV